ncbi:MAG: hypothetical protein WD225_06390 [Ilumatobacteraceae bacterium]
MGTVLRAIAGFLIPSLLLSGASSVAAPVSVAPGITARDASAEQLDLVRWAADRFETAGLELPVLEVAFHDDPSGCEGRRGYYRDGTVDMCPGTLINVSTRDTLLHEMGHSWSEQLPTDTRSAFLSLRGLREWSSSAVGWEERGWEQAAEVISWAIGERILTPTIPEATPDELSAGFELLTGVPMP